MEPTNITKAILDERERCAKLCDRLIDYHDHQASGAESVGADESELYHETASETAKRLKRLIESGEGSAVTP
jgi:hypothetical protein